MKHIFLSYSSKDSAYANWLDAELRSNDYTVWRDTGKIRGGDQWIGKLEAALQDAWAIIVIQSPHSKDSRWVRNETEFAEKCNLPVIPLLLSGDAWFGFLHTQYVDVRGQENVPLPDSFYDMLLQYAPPAALDKEIDLRILQSNTPQRLGLIPKLETLGRNGHSPKGYAARQLLQRLSYDSDDYVQVTAATALRKLKEPQQHQEAAVSPSVKHESEPVEVLPSPTRWVMAPQHRRSNRIVTGGLFVLLILMATFGGWLIGHSGKGNTNDKVDQSTEEKLTAVAVAIDLCDDGSARDEYEDPCNHDEDGDSTPDNEDNCPFSEGGGDVGCPGIMNPMFPVAPITPDNAARVTLFSREGRGWVQHLAWLDNGQTLAGVGPRGLWFYNSQDFTVAPGWINSIQVLNHGAAFSPDGSLLAYGSFDTMIHTIDVSTGEPRFDWEGHGGQVISVAFSPDGTLLATGDDVGMIRLWDINTGEFRLLEGHSGQINAVAFSPDSSLLASVSKDQTVRLWDVAAAAEKRILNGHNNTVQCVAFSLDGKMLATGGFDYQMRLWNVEDGTQLEEREYPGAVQSLAFSPDRKTLAVGTFHEVYLYEFVTGTPGLNWPVHTTLDVTSLAYNPDGTRLATTSGAFGIVQIWDTATGTEVAALHDHGSAISNVEFSPDGVYAFEARRDGGLRQWNLTSGEPFEYGTGWGGTIEGMGVSSDGTFLVTAGTESIVRLWDPTTYRFRADLLKPEPDPDFIIVPSLAFSSGGTLALGGREGIWLCEVTTPSCFTKLEGHPGASGIIGLDFSPDGRTLISTGRDSTVMRLWDVETGALLAEWDVTGMGITNTVYSPDGTLVATGGADNTVRLWDVATGQVVRDWPERGGWVIGLAFNPDGSVLAAGAFGDQLYLLNPDTGDELAVLQGDGQGTVLSIAFSQDGSLLLTGGEDGVVQLWSVLDQ